MITKRLHLKVKYQFLLGKVLLARFDSDSAKSLYQFLLGKVLPRIYYRSLWSHSEYSYQFLLGKVLLIGGRDMLQLGLKVSIPLR